MSDNENNEEIVEIKKEKKPRSQAQIDATKRMLEKRKEIDAIKRGHKEALKTEKELKLKDKVNKIKEVEEKMSKYKSADEEDEIVEPVKISKPKPKPKKKIIVEESSSEEEIVYVKKPKPKKKTKKKIVVQETSSSSSEEEEEVKPKKKSGNRHTTTELVNKKSEDQLRQDLHNEKLKNALRSLGYIE